MKTLVIAEKPSVGRDIARVLKCSKNNQGALEGDQYVVTWALGHLVTLADPETYDSKYKVWEMKDLPMLPEKFQLVVIKQTGKQYQTIKNHLYRKDISEVVVATDAGREGELVARWILAKAGSHKPVKRLWISSVTDKAIREGFAHLKDGRAYMNLYAAAEARAEADWLVGINGTRALTCKYNAQLSCGRVQTPTLSMIDQREKEIRDFKPEKYYGLTLSSGGVTWTWQDGRSASARTFSAERIEKIKSQVQGEKLTVKEVHRTTKKTYSPGLYDLTELQRDANKRFGFSAKETLNIMQRLYENHKVLTYPRTDSRYIGKDVAETLKERLKACSVGPYRKVAGKLISQPLKLNKSFVDDSKVSDHHAIIPTEQFVQLEHMSSDERKIYDLVVRRFAAVLYPPCEYEQTTLKGVCGGETFSAKGRVMKQPGWQAAYEDFQEEVSEEDIREQLLPEIKEGTSQMVKLIKINEGQTKPPAYYNEATLLTAMEKGGLGTVATRADIIDKLFHTFLMEKKDKDIHVTSKGRQLLELVPEDLKKPALTADWEKKLMAISEGRLKKDMFIRDIRGYTEEIVSEIRTGDGKFRHENLTNTKCPQCGKRMLSVKGKNSRMLVCQDRECGYRETVARTTNARCPKCHKRMEMYGKGDGQTFVCVCGYKEKLSIFQERRKKEGAGVSKRDVQKYLNKQKKEAEQPLNNAFAEAFAKLNLKN
ncbi:DNA topoisomerase III [Frisingicoccus caecimuris]|uniref:DNA topoisomerase 3 n=1 Tax=Frisingicoccus caecimuris TaxID=1796636 RepID=A0A4R2L9C3_9FIRM|nr:DNA topoisomerase III [Frisingicoccus caecimuris]MCR1919226.1 DNA topoisomerase III [Frisingicoccus caecimuris]TCO84323.1 DNA topoisomerase-3 [Frisingicoccus caecimuris]